MAKRCRKSWTRGPVTIARAPQTGLAGQLHEDAVNGGLPQTTAALGNEEVRAAPRSKMSIAPDLERAR
jgi:hypothetical protein